MNIQPDFKELLALLEKHQVEYMLVGGYAVAFHGYPRFTKDIDVYFENTDENINKIISALMEFGFSVDELPPDLFKKPGNIITLGVAPVRVDFLNEIDGVGFTEAKKQRVRGKYDNVDIYFIGKEDLIKNKRSTPRTKDKVDAEEIS
ncbi:MAG: hypothetical protein HW390_2058 [Candidatus Brocadiaceae bacterium]|nr:hypothetical protein [Candidatus Brocadiaceae bacterium]